jgi:hypothetical protein
MLHRSRGAVAPEFCKRHFIFLVTTGLDPVVYAEVQLRKPTGKPNYPCRRMDCRIKSGNDEGKKRKKKEAERRQTLFSSSPVGVPPRLSPKGVVVPKAQLRARLPGTWPERPVR